MSVEFNVLSTQFHHSVNQIHFTIISFFIHLRLQAQKATGLQGKIGTYGLPVIEFTRWSAAAAATTATTVESGGTAGGVGGGQGNAVNTPVDATGKTQISDNGNSSGSESVAAILESTEWKLTRVTLEADRSVCRSLHYTFPLI